MIAIIIVVVGVGLFGVVTGFLAERFGIAGSESDSPEGISDQQDRNAILSEISDVRREQETATRLPGP